MNFSLHAGDFCILINIFQVSSGIQLNYLENAWCFGTLLLGCVREDQSSSDYEDNYSLLLRQGPSVYFS